MKKIFFILVLLFVLAGAALAVFVLTFDANHYRPMIVEQVEKAINKPVEIEKISLGWHGQISFDLDGLRIQTAKASTNELIRLKSARVLVEFMPLLQKKLQVTSVILDQPVITLIQTRAGIQGLEPVPPSEEVSQKSPLPTAGEIAAAPAAAAAPVTFVVDKIVLTDGTLIYRDETKPVPSEISIRKIESTLKNIALDQPIVFTVTGAVLSQKANLTLDGVYENQKTVSTLRDFKGSLNLNEINLQEWNKFFASPTGAAVPFPGGELNLQMDSLVLDEQAAKNIKASIQYRGGKIVLVDNPNAIDNLQANAEVFDGRAEVQSLSADFAGGSINGDGAFNYSLPEPLLTFRASAQNLNLAQLAPARSSQEPQIEGGLSFNAQGTARGSDGVMIQRTLSGKGDLAIERGVIRNLNIIREIFSKLSMIPGLVRKLEDHLPPDYQEKLAERDTVLNPIQIPFSIEQGIVNLPRVNASTDSFEVLGTGQVGLDGRVNVPLTIFIEPELSNALIHSVNELQTVADQNGRVQLPVTLQGIAPQITPVVDLQFIASKIAMAKTQELLTGMMQKKTGGTTGTGLPGTTTPGSSTTTGGLGSGLQPVGSNTGSTGTTGTKPPKFKDLLTGFLETNMQNQDSSGTSSNTY